MAEHDNEQLPEGVVRIPLDGTFGAGPDAELTIVTKGEDGQNVEKIYIVPYLAIDLIRIQKMSDINFILGYKVVKSEARTPGLKELGL